jgi:AraC-like DNA-binding protein
VAQRFCRHRLEIVSEKNTFRATHHHVKGTQLTLNYIEYGADVAINPGELGDFYLIQMPVAGGSTIQHGRKEFHTNPESASILNPDLPTSMRWWKGCRQTLIQIPKRFLHEYGERVLERELQGSIIFDPEVKNTRDSSWKAMSNTLFDIADGKHGNSHTTWGTADEMHFFDLLFQRQNSNISGFFALELPEIGLKYLRRADEFIRSHCSLPISLLDISDAAGVTGRALQLAYKAHYGHSPMRALMLERLQRVRFDLLAHGHAESVTDVALKWGFSHLGRFSAAYKSEFGEMPSDTMGRSRRR